LRQAAKIFRLLLSEPLQFLAGFEADSFARRDIYFFAGARIAPDSGFSRLYGEYAESPQLDPLAASHAVFQRLKDRFYCLLGFHATDVRAFQFGQHSVDDVQFDQTFLRNLPPPLSRAAPRSFAPYRDIRAPFS